MNEAASSRGVPRMQRVVFAEERIARRRQGLDDRPPHRRCIALETHVKGGAKLDHEGGGKPDHLAAGRSF